MSDAILWYTTRGAGAVTLILLSSVVVLGILGTQRVHSPSWPRFLTTGLHSNLALMTLVFLSLHIVTAVVDPFTHSVLAGAEDGKLYRWNLATNTFSEQIVLTPGLGEAYTPTVAGPDGQVYAINNATLFAVGASNVGAPAAPPAERLALAAPQPNPFAGRTSLRFSLPRASRVTLEVIDLAGQRVRTLERGVLPAGEHVAAWDGTDGRGARRAPGVYFVRLTDGAASLTRKVLLTD